tara:strand:+ start:1037 stop:1312 length:276 start_codon:yes stop_codon:yes gene_type:complete
MDITFSETEIERFRNLEKPDFSEEALSHLENYTNIDMEELATNCDWKLIQNEHLKKVSKSLEKIHYEKIERWGKCYPEEKHPYGIFEPQTR